MYISRIFLNISIISYNSLILFPILSTHSSDENDVQNYDVNTLNDIDDGTQFKTITVEEYKKLMDLIPKVEKFKFIVQRMEKDIETKNAELQNLRSEKKKWKNLEHLSTVSIIYNESLLMSDLERLVINSFWVLYDFICTI